VPQASAEILVRTICFTLLAALLGGCHSPQPITRSSAELFTARTNYPAHWWTPVPTNGAPAWEILPQEARPGEVILSKRNELAWRYYEILTRIRAELRP
jgi:hypothetical protein